jgi:beta-glucosidase
MKALHNVTTFLVLLLCCSLPCSSAEYMKYKDPNAPLGARITDLLSRMTLAEKIGQMSQIERLNATSDVIQNYFIGTNCLKSLSKT